MKALEVSYFWTLRGLEGFWACGAVYGGELAQVLLGQPDRLRTVFARRESGFCRRLERSEWDIRFPMPQLYHLPD
jgi:hypothetical protein